MCDFSNEEFREYFPVFADVSDVQIYSAKEFALLEVCASTFGKACKLALRLLTAHNLALDIAVNSASSDEQTASGSGESSGGCSASVTLAGARIASETVAGVGSVSYDTASLASLNDSGISADYGQTSYGIRYFALLKKYSFGFGVGRAGGCGCQSR